MLEQISPLMLQIRELCSRELALFRMRWPALEPGTVALLPEHPAAVTRRQDARRQASGAHYGLWFRPFSPCYTLARVQGDWLELHRFEDAHINQLFGRSTTLCHRIHRDQLQGVIHLCFHDEEQSFSLYNSMDERVIERFPVRSRKRLVGLARQLRQHGMLPGALTLWQCEPDGRLCEGESDGVPVLR